MTPASPPHLLFFLHSIHSGLLLFHGYTGPIAASETLTLLYSLPVVFFSSDMPKACYFLAFRRSLFKVVFLLCTNTCNSLPFPNPNTTTRLHCQIHSAFTSAKSREIQHTQEACTKQDVRAAVFFYEMEIVLLFFSDHCHSLFPC